MTGDVDPLEGLREALRLSPGNAPLRIHLARSLVSASRAGEAEEILKEGLKLPSGSRELRLELARTYQRQAKFSAAFVIVEDEIAKSSEPAPAYLLHAQLLLATDEADRAARQYRKAIDLDPGLADSALEEELGLGEPTESIGIGAGAALRGVGSGQPSAEELFRLQRPTVGFDDVGGMEHLKEQVRLKIIHPLLQPDIYKAYGKKIGGGILMYGPPGCGKTHLARATAGEVKAAFISVGINDVLDMWIGNSEKNLHNLFELARANTPCVLFFDEVDALGASRRDMRGHAGRHVINQFLAELDGVGSSNDGVLILAATNAPWHLDSAFRRPGRFDRILFTPPPDAEARSTILEILLRGKPTGKIDYTGLAKKTKGLSGADLKAIVDRAIEGKLAEALRKGVPSQITQKDLLAVAKAVRPSTREWFSAARNYALYSNEAGIYDDLLPYLK